MSPYILTIIRPILTGRYAARVEAKTLIFEAGSLSCTQREHCTSTARIRCVCVLWVVGYILTPGLKRVFTEAYLYQEVYLQETEMLVDFLERRLKAFGAEVPAEFDTVVQVEREQADDGEGRMLWQYYFVNHNTRALFWIRPYKLDDKPSNPAHFSMCLIASSVPF